jgi:hypothetical protein
VVFYGDGLQLIFKTKGLTIIKNSKVFAHNEIYVGTELELYYTFQDQRRSSPKELYPFWSVYYYRFRSYKNEVYFSTSNEGLLKL